MALFVYLHVLNMITEEEAGQCRRKSAAVDGTAASSAVETGGEGLFNMRIMSKK